MAKLKVDLFAGETRLSGGEAEGVMRITVGSGPKRASGHPLLVIDDDRLPPVMPIAQFVLGKLLIVKKLHWSFPEDKNTGFRRLEAFGGGDLEVIPSGKLTLLFNSTAHGECRVVMEVVP